MRFAILILAVFCAVISGWTASLGQVHELAQMQDRSIGADTHHADASARYPITRDANPCPTEAETCDHHPRPVHPVPCAACFAVVIETIDIERDVLSSTAIRPQPQQPMLATVLKPRFPPPKSFRSIS